MSRAADVGAPPRTDPAARARDWIGLAARLVLGGALLYAGALKVGSPLVSGRAVQAYQILPFDLAAYVGYALPVLELVLGGLILIGLYLRPAAIAGTVLMVVFIAGILSAWARGLSIDCGCFGGGGAVAPDQTAYGVEIARDLLLAACGLWLAWRPDSPLRLDARLARQRR
ncbi:MAG TPA: DoxX family protein [Dermatophilaceae bacterium]|nr:DoxX family protein [Dermatophilaceae bacterium]